MNSSLTNIELMYLLIDIQLHQETTKAMYRCLSDGKIDEALQHLHELQHDLATLENVIRSH